MNENDSYDYSRRNTERISSNKKYEQRSIEDSYDRRQTEIVTSNPNEDKTKKLSRLLRMHEIDNAPVLNTNYSLYFDLERNNDGVISFLKDAQGCYFEGLRKVFFGKIALFWFVILQISIITFVYLSFNLVPYSYQ